MCRSYFCGDFQPQLWKKIINVKKMKTKDLEAKTSIVESDDILQSAVSNESMVPVQEGDAEKHSAYFDTYYNVTGIINGKKERVIPLFLRDYNMEPPADKKKLIGQLDKSKLLDPMFHLSKNLDIAYTEGLCVIDANGKEVPEEVYEEIKGFAYLFCPTPDSYWRIRTGEELKYVQIHLFESIEEYATAVGATALYGRGLNAFERKGHAAIASKNKPLITTHTFAKRINITASTADRYFDITIPSSITQKAMAGIETEIPPLGRTFEEAVEIYHTISTVLGEKAAKSRYAIDVVNDLSKLYSLRQVLDALNDIRANEVSQMEIKDCKEKSYCLSCVIGQHIKPEVKEAA